ncbi:MAG: hypothetical protein WCR30_00620, partial [Clostridia bacterium]
LFVVNSHESLSWLESNFNVEKLRLSYFQISNKSLLNTIVVAPTTFEWFDKMSNIIFLDAVTSNGYLQALSKFTNAKIFVPLNKSIDTSPFFGLKTNRIFMGTIFDSFKLNANKSFCSQTELLTTVCNETKCSYENVYLCYLIFKEIHVLDEKFENNKLSVFQTNEKGSLEQSKIATFIRKMSIPLGGGGEQ